MRTSFAAGAVLLALAPAQLHAHTADPAPDAAPEETLDTMLSGDEAAEPPAVPPPSGDPIIDRLNALEAKVQRLEARNAELERQAEFSAGRIEKVEVRAAKSVQPGVAPTFSDVAGKFTFKPRGTLQIDYAKYNERAGGYDYNDGTDLRRGRFGFDGTAFTNFRWRVEAEYVRNAVNLLDAYIAYQFSPKWLLTAGQHKAPYGLEANTSDSFNTFLERGMASNAFGAVGAERRVGLSLAYQSDKLNAALGVFGAAEGVQRNATTPDEVQSVNARITWDPVLDTGKVVHIGLSAYHANNFAANSLTIADRPNVRVDDGRLVSAAITGGVSATGVQTGVKNATYIGTEAALVRGPFSLQGEYGRLRLDRFAGAGDATFDGFNIFGSWFLTGESRTFRGGNVDRLRPLSDIGSETGGFGAIELAVRYDQLDLTDGDLSPLSREGETWTAAVNWYLNPNIKLLFNYIRFEGENSPLVVLPAINGTTAKGDAFATRLHIDF